MTWLALRRFISDHQDFIVLGVAAAVGAYLLFKGSAGMEEME